METTQNIDHYRVEQGQWGSEPSVILIDSESGSRATIIPTLGANCIAWSVQHNGASLEILETPPSAEDVRSRKFRSGVPVLWPFPGRVRNARYNFEGEEHSLARTDKSGLHHIHGLVNMAVWRVTWTGSTENGARAILSIGPQDISEELTEGFPFDFELNLTFTLQGNKLTYDFAVSSKEVTRRFPFGYGLHPYFRAPLAVSAAVPDRSACEVLIPAAKIWPIEEGIPNDKPEPVPAELDFQNWRPLGTQHYDNIFTGVTYDGDLTVAGYRDGGVGLEVRLIADAVHREWVLFTQPNRPSLCIEPYTCPPNAVNFKEENLYNAGLVVLEPGAQWQSQIIFEVRPIAE